MAPLKLLIIRSSITRKLLLPLAGFLLMFFIIGLAVINYTTRTASSKYMSQLQELVTKGIQLEIEDIMTTAKNIAYLNTAYIAENLDEPEVLEDELFYMLQKEININPNLSIIAIGLKNGFYAEVQRLSKDMLRYGIRQPGQSGDLEFFTLDNDNKTYTNDRVKDYDPRLRPWYTSAIAIESSSWAEPYKLASSGSPAIAISTPIKKEGVSTVTLELSFLSKALLPIAKESKTEIILLDKNYRILASSIELPRDVLLQHVSILKRHEYAPKISIHFAEAENLGEKEYRTIDRHLISKKVLSVEGLYLNTVFVTDREDIVGPFTAIRNSSLINLVGFLIISIFIMMATERRIKARFKRLTDYTSITETEDDIQQLAELTADPDEIGQLARALLAYKKTIAEQQERILFDLEEKSRMVREIDHRVKNNIQMMSSIMALEAESHEPKTRDIILFLRKLILTMGIVHDIAYNQPRLSSIDLSGYFASVIQLFEDRLNPDDTGMEYLSKAEIMMDMPLLIPHGIVLAYLIGKIKKDTTRASKIYIELSEDKKSFFLLISCDKLRKDNKLNDIFKSALINGLLAHLSAKLDKYNLTDNNIFIKMAFKKQPYYNNNLTQ